MDRLKKLWTDTKRLIGETDWFLFFCLVLLVPPVLLAFFLVLAFLWMNFTIFLSILSLITAYFFFEDDSI